MAMHSDELRDAGREENEYVLAVIFNPEAALFSHVDYVRETAHEACLRAERNFGAADVLHIEALANLALFYWYREENAQLAAAPLKRAKSLLASQAAQHPELAAELIALQVLLHVLERRDESDLCLVRAVLDAADFAWDFDRSDDDTTTALEIVSLITGCALRSEYQILPYLARDVGRSFAFDLVAQGRRSDAGQFLSDTLLPLATEVWGRDAFKALYIEQEAGWLTKPRDIAVGRALKLDRMIEHVRNLVSEPARPRGRRPLRDDPGNEAKQALDSLIAATGEDRTNRLGGVITAIEAARQAMADGDDDTGQIVVSLACLIFASEDPDRQSAEERAIQLVKRWLERSYARPKQANGLFRDRVCVVLADFYRQRAGGDPEDNLNEILVLTDDLDLDPDDAPYHWGLAKLLRGLAYARRREWKNVGEPAGDAFAPFMDVEIAVRQFKSSLEKLERDTHPWEWALAQLYWSDAVLPITPARIDQETAEGLTFQLRSAEAVLTPLLAPVEWARIQKNLSEISRRPLSPAGDADDDEEKEESEDEDLGELETEGAAAENEKERHLGDPPVHILTRAQLMLDGPEHEELRAWLEIEKARYFAALGSQAAEEKAISAYRTGIANFPKDAGLEKFTACRELAALLFSRGAFAEAGEIYEQALVIGKSRLMSSYSMNARRVAIFDLKGIGSNLAFCHVRSGDLERAVIMLDECKSILLNDNLRARYAKVLVLNPDKRLEADRMASEIRTLEADAYGGMQYSENVARLIALRKEFSQFDVPHRDALSLKALQDLPDGCAIIVPLVTEHGTSVIIARGASSGSAELSALEIPALTDAELKGRLFGQDGAGWFDTYQRRSERGQGEAMFDACINGACEWLGEALFAPIVAHLSSQNIRELILVPGGGLQFLPLHAASVVKGSAKNYLIDSFDVRLVPSIATLGLLQSVSRAESTGIAIVAGVSNYKNEDLSPLPCVAIEVAVVADRLGAHPILDAQVTPSILAERLQGAPILHLACHGESWAEDVSFAQSFEPQAVLMLSEGGLSFRDILADWNLESTELVTLSACDTGLVDFSRPSDEFEGLSHVLLQAGARRVVGSLWSVDDRSTAILMRRFYKNLREGSGYAAALSQAQQWLRGLTYRELCETESDLFWNDDGPMDAGGDECPFDHPYFWAPFFLTG